MLAAWRGVYSVNPGEVGVVRTFGKETGQTQPGLHFRLPIAQEVNIVDMAKVRREEVGFRSTQNGAKRVDSEALMLTGDENIIEAQMIVQYQVLDPSKYLFRLSDPEKTLHIASEVALREVVGQMNITSSIEDLPAAAPPKPATPEPPPEPEEAPKDEQEEEDPDDKDAPPPSPPPTHVPDMPDTSHKPSHDTESDILTRGRERAQVATKILLQKLMDLYDSGLKITEVKLQVVDAPDEVKDAFHDVVRAREEREQLINKALGYREDRIPKARGEAQKIIRAAEAYKRERVLRSEGEAKRFAAILAEYKKARAVTRERLHLETMERILNRVPKKVFIDKDVAENALPLLNIGGGNFLGGNKGGQ